MPRQKPRDSVSFDRAAEHYDATRGFPPAVGAAVADAALEMTAGAAAALEIGIGTGRIARPLMARGLRVTGVDLSRGMMGGLLGALSPREARPALVEADAAELPLRSESFDAVIAVHVLHLIAGWREAIDEVRRVLRPGGVFLTGYDWRPDGSPGQRLFERWRSIVRAEGLSTDGPGARDFDDVRRLLIDSGAALDQRTAGEWHRTRTLARHLETIEHRTWSSTWDVPDDFFPRCLASLRAWAVAEYGDLEREFTTPHRFIWQAFRW